MVPDFDSENHQIVINLIIFDLNLKIDAVFCLHRSLYFEPNGVLKESNFRDQLNFWSIKMRLLDIVTKKETKIGAFETDRINRSHHLLLRCQLVFLLRLVKSSCLLELLLTRNRLLNDLPVVRQYH
jgi:hypothetical protein